MCCKSTVLALQFSKRLPFALSELHDVVPIVPAITQVEPGSTLGRIIAAVECPAVEA